MRNYSLTHTIIDILYIISILNSIIMQRKVLFTYYTVILTFRGISVECLVHMRHYTHYNNYVVSNLEMPPDQWFPVNNPLRPFRQIQRSSYSR